jgi:hypothetical protein
MRIPEYRRRNSRRKSININANLDIPMRISEYQQSTAVAIVAAGGEYQWEYQ